MDLRTGESITAAQAQNGAYIWTVPNAIYFKVMSHHEWVMGLPFHEIVIRLQFNHNLRKALGIHKCWMTLTISTVLRSQTWRFLRVFKTQVMRYLDRLGVISINTCILACDHVLFDVIHGTIDVDPKYEIIFNLY
ncbi:c3 protein [Cowpea golden mosaic virus]|uniref:Replication enhancer n=1 Tax=Cowpea golden mosaic virus TaxID=69263 RepID=O55377_9GEMI|nr:c3 protein [Cowpea golden mosaic virus-[Nigeria]]AAB87609.1 c3 protein [Cowpea golden mosaic virus-[Nigeria]]